jgi:adenylate kinase family enzyme
MGNRQMRYKEIIEAFNNPYKGKWEKSDYGDVDLNIKLPDGTPLSIMFNQEYDGEGEEVIQVEFYRNNSQDVTGEGDAQRIFATVLDAIQKYIKKYKPQQLSFSASKSVDMDADDVEHFNPESRAKLYTRLVQRYAGAWGYQSQHSDEGDVVIYQLTRAQGVAEAEIDEGVHDPHIFKCIFLFGPMGAGKSTVASPLLSHTGLRSVNLDNFNEMFVKKGQVPTGHLAPDQLEKSWQLSQTQQNNFADGRLGIIIDGSGRNPNTAINVIETLAPLGYEFMMIFVNVSEATSIARQQSRAAKQQQQWGAGRQVDPILAKNTYTQVQNNLGKYYAYFGPERFVYVDNENTPNLTQATKKVDAFLRAPVKQPEALEWIKAQKGGQQVTQQQQKLATAQTRQQQALKQFNPLNPKFARQGMAENFHDGKNPQDKGDSKRHGVPTKASISTLRKVAKQGGRKGQLAHWMANMKSGRAKAKRK